MHEDEWVVQMGRFLSRSFGRGWTPLPFLSLALRIAELSDTCCKSARTLKKLAQNACFFVLAPSLIRIKRPEVNLLRKITTGFSMLLGRQ